jgi:hypothetical protein
MTTKLQTFDGNIGIGTHDPGAYRLRVEGAFRANALEINGVSNAQVPSGSIAMWSGTVASIPTGWVLCDGTNSTPNLVGRFVRGASGDAPSPVAVNTTGGANTVTLSIPNLATHTHTGNSGNQSADHGHTATVGNQSADHTHPSSSIANTTNHNHTITSAANTTNHSHPTGNQSANHTHTGTSGNNSANHSHPGTTGSTSTSHSHTMQGFQINTGRNYAGSPPAPASVGNWSYNSGVVGQNTVNANAPPATGPQQGNHGHFAANSSNQSANHTHTHTTSNQSANHTHPMGNQSANHTHSGTTATQSAANHNHTVTNGNQSASHNHSVSNGVQSASHNHTLTIGNAGTGTAVSITNPYYVLAYIMKT